MSPVEQPYVNQALATTLVLGFKFLAWTNGLGVLLTLLCSLGIVPLDLSSYLLRLPLAAFLAGLSLSGVGLLWSCLVQTSLLGQLLAGRSRRTHWIPMFCMLVSYGLSLIAFVLGCWFTLNLAAAADHGGDSSQSFLPGSVAPSDQSGHSLRLVREIDASAFVGKTVALF